MSASFHDEGGQVSEAVYYYHEALSSFSTACVFALPSWNEEVKQQAYFEEGLNDSEEKASRKFHKLFSKMDLLKHSLVLGIGCKLIHSGTKLMHAYRGYMAWWWMEEAIDQK